MQAASKIKDINNFHDINEVMEKHGKAMILYARQWCDAPEDVVQDSLVKLLMQPEPLLDPVPWLYKVIRNTAIDVSRKRQRRQRHLKRIKSEKVWFYEQAQDEDDLNAKALTQALENLPIEERETIVAHLWGRLDFETIGKLTGCSRSTANRRYQRGLNQMKRILEGETSGSTR